MPRRNRNREKSRLEQKQLNEIIQTKTNLFAERKQAQRIYRERVKV